MQITESLGPYPAVEINLHLDPHFAQLNYRVELRLGTRFRGSEPVASGGPRDEFIR